MITDALLSFAGWVMGWLGDTLPEGDLAIPGAGGVAGLIAKADSLAPVSGIVTAALGVLSAVLVFIVVRLVLVVWNLIWP